MTDNKNRPIGVIITLGSRDVQKNGKVIEKPKQEGESILKSWKESNEGLSLPIIQAVLKHAGKNGKITRVLLIGTNQSLAAPQFQEKDTLNFAKIAERLIPDLVKGFAGAAENANVKSFGVDANPTLMGQCWETLSDNSKFVNFLTEMKELAEVTLSTTGGVPGLNTVVQHLCYVNFRDKLSIVHVDEKLGEAVPTNIVEFLEKQTLKDDIFILADRFYFAAIARKLQGKHVLNTEYSVAMKLAEYGASRLAFDFETAKEKLIQILALAKPITSYLDKNIQDLKLLLGERGSDQERRKALISELSGNLLVKWAQEEYVDVLGRLFRLLEETTISLVEECFQIGFCFSENSNNYPEYKKFVSENPPLLEFLKQQKIGGNALNWEKLNIDTGIHVLRFFSNETSQPPERIGRIADFGQIYGSLKHLKQLRNKCIMAHGFHGVSRKDFEKDFKGNNFEETIYKLTAFSQSGSGLEPWKILADRTRKILD